MLMPIASGTSSGCSVHGKVEASRRSLCGNLADGALRHKIAAPPGAHKSGQDLAHLRSRHGVALPRHSGPSIVTTGATTGSGRGRVRPRAASAELERDERSDQLPALLSSRPPEPTRPCSDLLRDRLRGGLPVRGVGCSERTEVVERELRSELYSYDALLSPSPLERLRLARGGREKAKEAPGIACPTLTGHRGVD